jgi:4-hydroxybutyrate dehydrogenase
MIEMVYNFPSSIYFKWGETNNIVNHVKAVKSGKILVVTDKGIRKVGIINDVEERLSQANIDYFIFDDVQPNPTNINVMDGLSAYKENSCDSILAIGGGSPIDAAKGILLMVNHKGKLSQYYRGASDPLPITDEMPPFIAVPTTAGTGSETSRGAIITDETNRKRSIGSQYLLPKSVILDPALTQKMPPKLTAYTGLDALSHNLEAIVVDRYAPICDAFAIEGLKLVSRSLVNAYREGSDRKARMDMMMASTMGSLAFMKGLGVIHSLAHQLSTQCDVPHGAACGIMIPHAIRYNLHEKSTQNKYAEFAKIFSGNPESSAEDAPGIMEKLLDTLNVEGRLREWGVKKEDIPVMAANAMLDHCHPRNPRTCSLESMKKLYEQAL